MRLVLPILLLSAFATITLGAESPKNPAVGASDKIDKLIEAGYREHGIVGNPKITDEQFVRRVYLDIVGRIPSIKELDEFTASKGDNRREKLVEKLLGSEGYVSHTYNYWADILRINTRLGSSGTDAEAAYKLWVKDSLRSNKPYDQFVREMVAANGKIWDNGAVGYYQRDRGMPLDNMSNTVRVFLGTRLECAQCHNHPFDKWTQMDYFQMAAFSYNQDANNYGGVNRKIATSWQSTHAKEQYLKAVKVKDFPYLRKDSDYKKFVKSKNFPKYLTKFKLKDEKEFKKIWEKGFKAYNSAYQETRLLGRVLTDLYNPIRYSAVRPNTRTLQLPHDYQYDDAKPKGTVTASAMFGEELAFDKDVDAKEKVDAYADWMTSKENPTFTRVIANRLWKRVFGVGVFEPVDEITDHTMVSNPQLMDYLVGLMKDLDYDQKAFLKILYTTDLYQSAAHQGEIALGVPYHFPGPAMRRMSAEQVWDSVMGLSIEDPDHYLPGIAKGLALVEKSRQIYKSLEEIPSEEDYLAMIKDLTKKAKGAYEEQDRIRKQIYAAREKEQTDRAKELSRELSSVRGKLVREMQSRAYVAVKKENDSGKLMAAAGMTAMGGSMEGAMMGGGAVPVMTSLPKPTLPEMPAEYAKDKNMAKKWKAQMSNHSKGWSNLTRGLARASELPSPAPRGHFLREFGQSDRETIENSQQSASVPQALNLLNGPLAETIVHPFSVLGRQLQEVETPEEEIHVFYRAMLSREPHGREVELLAGEYETAKSKEDARRAVAWALLNTQQFLFVD